MQQLDLWSLLDQDNQHPGPVGHEVHRQQDAHRHARAQHRLPAALIGWELMQVDYAPKGYRAAYWPLSIFTELHPP